MVVKLSRQVIDVKLLDTGSGILNDSGGGKMEAAEMVDIKVRRASAATRARTL
jgi:hypothetical protein